MDFDGTLTWWNSPSVFLVYAVGVGGLLRRLPRLIGVWWRWQLQTNRSLADLKRDWLRVCFSGKKKTDLFKLSIGFTHQCLLLLMRPNLLAQLKAWKQQGATVTVVSASLDIWLEYICQLLGFQLICTRTFFHEDGSFGGFDTPNCNGAEKANRVQKAFDLAQFQHIVAYGNTKGDVPMLQLAHEAWYYWAWGRFRAFKKD